MSFRVYDGWGNCISEFTGTLQEWQAEIAPRLAAKSNAGSGKPPLSLVK